MSRLILLIFGAACLCATPSGGDDDSNVVVEWSDIRKFVDIRAGSGNQRRFEQHLFKELESHIRAETSALPKNGDRLVVTVHDLDLAGEIEMNSMGLGANARIIREPTLTMIDIEFQLLDASGTIIS